MRRICLINEHCASKSFICRCGVSLQISLNYIRIFSAPASPSIDGFDEGHVFDPFPLILRCRTRPAVAKGTFSIGLDGIKFWQFRSLR